MAKEKEFEFDPIKNVIGGKAAEKVIWSTAVINKALEGIQQGQPLKASPFLNKNTKLLKPELVRRYTPEEIDDYKRCAVDPIYFAEKCYLMTPEGLKPCKLRDYQKDYIRHLQHNRFSIFLSCRQSGKCFSYLSSVKIFLENISQNAVIKEKLNSFYIKDNIYNVPIFELYNLYCKQTLIWKCKYHLYKIIYRLTYDRKKRNDS